MHSIEREIILRVHNGDPENLPFLHLVSQYKGHAEMFLYLSRQGLTGETLTDFIKTKCNSEPLRFLGF